MKSILTILLLSLLVLKVQAQEWISVGGGMDFEIRCLYPDTVNHLLYAAGRFREAGGDSTNQIAVWDGNSWTSLCEPGIDNSNLLGVVKYNDELIVSGSKYYMGDVITGSLAKLTPSGWESFNENADDKTSGLTIINDELYTFGWFDSIDGLPIHTIAKWNGTLWDSVGTQAIWDGVVLPIWSITKYNENLIVAGNFELGNNFKEIAQWDGTDWQPLMNGIVGEAWINDLIVYKGILYVGGEIAQSLNGNPSDDIMAWNGTEWFDPFPDVHFAFQVEDLKVIDDELYIVGAFNFEGASTYYSFSKFDGEYFCAFGGDSVLIQDPKRITGLDGEIYVACNRVLYGDTVNYIAKWNGTGMDTCIFSPITIGITESTSLSKSLELFPNPSRDEVVISWVALLPEQQTISITDQLGKEVLSVRFESELGENKLKLDVSDLSDGVYLFLLSGSAKPIRFVKR